jgi:hypothetical protein
VRTTATSDTNANSSWYTNAGTRIKAVLTFDYSTKDNYISNSTYANISAFTDVGSDHESISL